MTTTTNTTTMERIGIDESGKGDYFGPLVIAAVFVDATTHSELTLMNVRDSKKISDGRILEMAPDIRMLCPHSIIAIGPPRYNELYAKIRNFISRKIHVKLSRFDGWRLASSKRRNNQNMLRWHTSFNGK